MPLSICSTFNLVGTIRDILKVHECCCIPLKPVPITKKNQMLLAKTNLGIVLTFILCHSLRILLNIEDLATHNATFQDLNNSCRYGHPFWVLISHPISETLLKLNSTVNFFIYCAFNDRFRKAISERFIGIMSLCRPRQCQENMNTTTQPSLVLEWRRRTNKQ